MIAFDATAEPFDPEPLLRRYAQWLRENGERLPRSANGHSRTLLHRTRGFEIVAMRWDPGAVTPIHDHGDSRCSTLLVTGALSIEHFARTEFGRPDVTTIVERDVVRLGPGEMESLRDATELHRVRTVGGEAALAVHLYALPLRRFHTFDERDGRIASNLATYDLVLAP